MPHTVTLQLTACALSSALGRVCGVLAKWSLLITVFLTGALTAWAQAPAASNSKLAVDIDRIETLAAVSPELTLQQVLDGQAGAFKRQATTFLEDPSWARSLWVKVYLRPTALPTEAANLGSVLELNKPYVDDASLFTPHLGASGWQWQREDTGLRYPARAGAIIGHLPFFSLPSAAELADQPAHLRFVMLRVQHRLPLTVSISVKQTIQVLAQSYVATALLAMTLGMIALVCFMTGVLAWLHRDPTYAWYAVYAGSAWFLCASMLGFSHQVIWPIGGDWPITVIPVSLMIALAAKLQFCRLIFLQPGQLVWLNRVSIVVGGLSALVCAAYVFLEGYWTMLTLASFVLTCTCIVLILILGAWGLLRHHALGKIWLLAFAPVALTVIYRLLEAIGWASEQLFSFNTGVYALGLEVLIMGIAILWLARNRQSANERRMALESTDPLTGFVNAEVFHSHLQRGWHSDGAKKHDMAVIYIELQTKATDRVQLDRLLKRCVRVLRSATQSDDIVARFDGALMGILMPRVQMGDDLSQRLSRMVALGLMPDRSGSDASILQFRIVATTRWHYDLSLAQLDTDMRAFLNEPNGWGSKPIRFLDHRKSERSRPREIIDSSGLEDIWGKALEEQAKQDGQASDGKASPA